MLERSVLGKIIVSALVLLAFSTLISVSVIAISQQNPTPKEKADKLICLLKQANTTVIELFQRFESKNMKVPPQSLEEYNKAMDLAEEIADTYRAGNYSETSSKTVQALQSLKEAMQILFESADLQQTETEINIEKTSTMNSTINRYLNELKNIESLLESASTAGLDTSLLDAKAAVARSLLQNASSNLAQQNFQATTACINEVDSSIKQLVVSISGWTARLEAPRLETYINQIEIRLAALRAKATITSNTLSLTALRQAETNVDLAKTYLAQNRYNQTIAELISAKESEEKATQALKPYPTTADSAAEPSNSTSKAASSTVHP